MMIIERLQCSITHRVHAVLTAVMMLIACISSIADAAGTPAGTVIRSRSQVVYTTASGTMIDTVYSAYVSITVVQVGSVNMSPLTNALQTVSDSVSVDYPFTITNSGNGADRITLSGVSTRGWTIGIYADTDGDGVLQPSEAGNGTISQTPLLSADAVAKLIMRVHVPRGDLLDGIRDTTRFSASSNFDNTKSISGLCVTTVRTANLSLPTALTVDNPNPSPGMPVVFTLTLTNSGSVTASVISVTDQIPVGFSLISGSTTQGTFNGSAFPISWTVGSIPPGGSVQLKLTLSVNATVPAGSSLNNQYSISYTVGGNTYYSSSNIRSVSVGGSPYGVGIVSSQSSFSKEPSDTAVYRYTIKNNGVLKDVIVLSASSSRSTFSWALYKDVNNNGVLDAPDVQVTKTDSIAAGDSVRIFARSIVPRLTSNLLKDTLHVTARSTGDISQSAAIQSITTVNIPIVNLIETVSPAGNQPAGTVMTYTISYSNTGSASVSNFMVSDVTSSLTSYVANSIQLNGSALHDNASNVQVSVDGSGNTVVGVNVGTLNAQTTGKVSFQVRIK